MKLQKEKNSLTREQAAELYDDLERAMSSLMGKDGKPAEPAKRQSAVRRAPAHKAAAAASPTAGIDPRTLGYIPLAPAASPRADGKRAAVLVVCLFAMAKVATALLDASGVFGVSPAQASLQTSGVPVVAVQPAQRFTREEVKVLTSLDERRTLLEDRSKKLDERERDIERRDQEFATRLTQLRELTNLLKVDREKNDKKRSGQLEQLANVYGSMDPKEAASLIEQLDVTIALALLQKMPEKRIAQVLSLMTPARALSLTNMLSGRIE